MKVFELAADLKITPSELIIIAKKSKIDGLVAGTSLTKTEIDKIKKALQPDSSEGRLKKKSSPAKKEAAVAEEKEVVKKSRVKKTTTKQDDEQAEAKPAKAKADAKKTPDKKSEAKPAKELHKIEPAIEDSKSKSAAEPKISKAADTESFKKAETAAPALEVIKSDAPPASADKAELPNTTDGFRFIKKTLRKPIKDEEDFVSKEKIKKTPGVFSYKFDNESRFKKKKFSEDYGQVKFRKFHKKPLKQNEISERKKEITISKTITISELSNLSGIKAGELIKQLMQIGIMANINQIIDSDVAQLICQEFGIAVKVEDFDPETLLIQDYEKIKASFRPPVVTIMGHVDHGKTSLLDKIRKSNVVATEAGGITQHIGAYFVNSKDGGVTFLDTPGHEAFTAMRSRGTLATDIVVLVVAADDGPKPQTVEAVSHAKAAGVPILVAINKCDKPGADPEKTKQKLLEIGLAAENYGGDVTMVNVSAKTGQGIEELLSYIILQAQTMELTAYSEARAYGVVIESRQDRIRGNVVSFLVQNGTLRIGDIVIAGTSVGKIRAMQDSLGNKLETVAPSHPVELLGLDQLPQAGDKFNVVDSEKTAKLIQHSRMEKASALALKKNSTMKMEDIFNKIQEENKLTLNLILKTDVHGSLEAIQNSLNKWNSEKIEIKYLHAAVGAITSSDVALASASNAIIIGFNVRPDSNARNLSEKDNVQIKLYNVIYNIFDDIKASLEGMISPIIHDEDLGKLEVLELFTIPKVGVIAGCKVTSGKVTSGSICRVVRDNVVIYNSKIKTLKRFKDDAKEVLAGFECGILLETNKDLKAGDQLEAFLEIKTQQHLTSV